MTNESEQQSLETLPELSISLSEIPTPSKVLLECISNDEPVESVPLIYKIGDNVETRVRFGKSTAVESWIDCTIIGIHKEERSYDLKVNDPGKYNVNPEAVHVPENLLRLKLDSVTRNRGADLRSRTSSLLDRFEEVNARFKDLRIQVENTDGANENDDAIRNRGISLSRSATWVGTLHDIEEDSDSGRWSPTVGSLMSPLPEHYRQPSQTLTEFFGSQQDMNVVTREAAEQFLEIVNEMEVLREENIRVRRELMQAVEKVALYQQTTTDFEQKYSELLEEIQFLREEIERYDTDRENLSIRLRKQTAEILYLEKEADAGRERENEALMLKEKLGKELEAKSEFFQMAGDAGDGSGKGRDELIQKLQAEVENLKIDLQNSLKEHERKDAFIDRLRTTNLDSGEEILKLDSEFRKLQSKSKNDVLRLRQMRGKVTDLQDRNFHLKKTLNDKELTGAFNNPGEIQEYEEAQHMLEEENNKLNKHLRALMETKQEEDENIFTLLQQLGENDVELSKSVRCIDFTTDQDREESEMEFFFLTALSLQINLNQKYELMYESNGIYDRPSVMAQPVDEIWKSAQCDQVSMNSFHEYIDTYLRAKCLLPQAQNAEDVASSKKAYCVIS